MKRLMFAALFVVSAPLALAAEPAAPAPAAPAALAAPTIPGGLVLHPVVTLDGKSYNAGTGFVVDHGGRWLVVTAYNLLGPNGGLPKLIDAKKVPTEVTSVGVTDAYTAAPLGKTGPGLAIDAKPMDNTTAGNDVAAFPIDKPTAFDTMDGSAQRAVLTAGHFAAADPKLGEPVWLAAQVDGSTDRAHPAKVVQIDANFLFIEYADPKLVLAGSVGAPIVNAKGEVVGLNLGGAVIEGALIGSGAPVSAVKARIDGAKAP